MYQPSLAITKEISAHAYGFIVSLQSRLSHGRCQIVELGAVVYLVARPGQIDLCMQQGIEKDVKPNVPK